MKLLKNLNLDTLASLAWGVLFLKLWATRRLYLLIHPHYEILAVTAGLILLALGILQLLQVQPGSRDGNHVTLLSPRWSNCLLLGAALLGIMIPPRPFTSAVAFQRGITDTFTTARNVQSFRNTNRPEERSIVEWVRTLNVYPEPDAYKGQKVKVEGFVVHPPDLPPQYFLISRFVITCCAADVYPVGLLVKLTGSDRSQYPPDRWFKIEGEMATEEIASKRQLAIIPKELTPIGEPQNPYSY